MASTNLAYVNERREDREEVHYRTVAIAPDRDSIPLLVVNISPNGLMARCDRSFDPGTILTFRFPGLQSIAPEVRWCLGGRIGCEFTAIVPIHVYFAILPQLRD